MERVIFFFVIQLAASAYALARGGAPERIVGAALLIAAVAGRILQAPAVSRFIGVDWGVLGIDVALMFVLLGVALYADRFWPLWLAAFQILGTGGHIVRGMDADVARIAYAILLASWSYPMLLLLVIGTARHGARLRRHGYDLDWSHRAQGALP